MYPSNKQSHLCCRQAMYAHDQHTDFFVFPTSTANAILLSHTRHRLNVANSAQAQQGDMQKTQKKLSRDYACKHPGQQPYLGDVALASASPRDEGCKTIKVSGKTSVCVDNFALDSCLFQSCTLIQAHGDCDRARSRTVASDLPSANFLRLSVSELFVGMVICDATVAYRIMILLIFLPTFFRGRSSCGAAYKCVCVCVFCSVFSSKYGSFGRV